MVRYLCLIAAFITITSYALVNFLCLCCGLCLFKGNTWWLKSGSAFVKSLSQTAFLSSFPAALSNNLSDGCIRELGETDLEASCLILAGYLVELIEVFAEISWASDLFVA